MSATKYTLVQHTGYSVNAEVDFRRSVELRGVSDAQAKTVEAAGGLVFNDYLSASDAEEAENYPPGHEGLIPRVTGDFVRVSNVSEAIYRPLKRTLGIDDVIFLASGLKTDDDSNPEYDRALVELSCAVLGLGTDEYRQQIASQIGVNA